MSLIAKQPEGIPAIPGDTYQAICYLLIDIGTQHSELYDKDIPQVIIGWEIPELRIDVEREGQQVNLPRVISKTYTNSLHEKSTLTTHLVSWRGREFTKEEYDAFDLRNILGKNCLLTVTNALSSKGKTVAKIASVSKLVKGMTLIAKPENPVISFDMNEDGVTNIPEGLPDWIKEQIKKSIEYQAVQHAADNPALKAAHDAAGLNDNDNSDVAADDIPF
ncbi:MAG: hypothetical protein PHY02_10820 [Phycisphaerae bacterium]|nr:hypothetical protein [Phycisphaerae bacterium]